MTKLLGLFLVVVCSLTMAGCGGGSGSSDIETWLIEVGNDFPAEAKCVADAMSDYSVSDFEDTFDGGGSEEFNTELDAAYDRCDAELGITTE